MNGQAVDPDDLRLCLEPKVTVSSYGQMVRREERDAIATFIKCRLVERYITPIRKSKKLNGFLMMASACLMIETIESFRQGREHTKDQGAGKSVFRSFFERERAFSEFAPLTTEFYEGIRCGILHQGETTLGWRIRRDKGGLLEGTSRTVNADEFFTEIEASIEGYAEELRNAPWDCDLWCNFRSKMEKVIEHCRSERPLSRSTS